MGRNHTAGRQPERMTAEEYRRRQRNQPARRRARDYVGVLLGQLDAAGLPAPKREVPFPGLCGTRKWRFDLAWPNARVAVEYQGGVFHRAASHSSIGGLLRDYEKFTEASISGWTLILVTARDVRSGRAAAWIERAVGGQGNGLR